ncbi:hypothetical protein J2X85_000001 [Microbacterium trichothecenolyticum]|uniref:hypothetical protein n=1 Tax=Microbacterium trichothecenolyticum TaxID=69370 RepID=UPI0028625282|nr:hypothetical protein [Microbacterium trichothecenolyticum]MDR7182978.1 hypothetical protein [Microbacterium trichothecenolyticum]
MVSESMPHFRGDDPPFDGTVFVLTPHRRDLQPMGDGTTHHFLAHGIESAPPGTRDAAGDRDISIQSAQTINQLLGAAARLFDGVRPLDLEQVYARAASTVTHVTCRVLHAGQATQQGR